MADSRCWTKEFVIDFINIYEQHPCLWRVKSKAYANKHMKNEAYDKLVTFCKPIFPNANRDFVSKKIQSLRGSFRKEMKKVLESKRSGSSTDDAYIPTLWYYDLLMFTMDQELPTANISNMDSEESRISIGDEGDEGDADDGNDHEEHYDHDSVDEPYPDSIDEGQCTETQHEQEESSHKQHLERTKRLPPPSVPKKMKRKINMTEATFDFMKVCSRAIAGYNTKDDVQEYDAAGISVAKKLQKMDPLQAIYAETLINVVLKRGLLKTLQPHTDLCDNQCNIQVLPLQPPSTSPFYPMSSESQGSSFMDQESAGPSTNLNNMNIIKELSGSDGEEHLVSSPNEAPLVEALPTLFTSAVKCEVHDETNVTKVEPESDAKTSSLSSHIKEALPAPFASVVVKSEVDDTIDKQGRRFRC